METRATTTAELEARVIALETALAAERARADQLATERDQLRASHERLRLELELLKRRIFVAKAERVDTIQLELEFAEKLHQLDTLAGTLGLARDKEDNDSDAPKRDKKKPTGRRDLRTLALEEDRVELVDPVYEALVAEGKAERMGFEESAKLGFKRGGFLRVLIARQKYRVVDAKGAVTVDTTPMPPETFARSLAAPSLIAHILMEKYGRGLPLFRIEDGFARDGVPLDRGTMSRWVEDAGGTAGATVISAARIDATEKAFCIATDATGVAIQPVRSGDRARQSCRRGHFFVHIADRDHIFFEYTPKETSATVRAMFKGYAGYIQADAKSVYDVLYRDPDEKPPDDDVAGRCLEVGCWAHCRRRYWEAALAKSVVAREGVVRIGRIFELDATWRGKPPTEIKRLREAHLRPHVDAFLAWAASEYEKVRDQRGLLRSALGYSVRQADALLRFLDDGRLVLDNNRSERELRRIAVGRKAWLFCGSDDHAESAGHIFSLIASARLHKLDPEAYLRDLFRVLAHWPRDRYLELAPKYWAETRSRLDAGELAREVGPLSVPPPVAAAEHQSAPNVTG